MPRLLRVAPLAGYLLVVLELTLVLCRHVGSGANLLPLATTARLLRAGGYPMWFNLAGNVALFLPLGFLLPPARLIRTSALRVTLLALLLSLTVESLQYASGARVADVDDVLLNTLGGALGYLAWRGLTSRPLTRRSGEGRPSPPARRPRPAPRLEAGRAGEGG